MIEPMMTKDQLAALLLTVPVEAVAKEADVSTKTIYRLRHMATNPTIDSVARIVAAAKRIKAKRAKAAA